MTSDISFVFNVIASYSEAILVFNMNKLIKTEIYQTKSNKLPGTNYREVLKKANVVFKSIKRKTKRKPYLRSAYFLKQKVFFDYFWLHLFQKREAERARRLAYFEAALELIQNSRNHPESMQNPNKKSETLHRFTGVTKNKEVFYVQIKENKRKGTKQFMSLFPAK